MKPPSRAMQEHPPQLNQRGNVYQRIASDLTKSNGPGAIVNLAQYTPDNRTVRIVGMSEPQASTQNLPWYVDAVVEYRVGACQRREQFRWPAFGWSMLLCADQVNVFALRRPLAGWGEVTTYPTAPADGWRLGAAVLDATMASAEVVRTVDFVTGMGPVTATRIPFGATRCRLEIPNGDYDSGALAGWADDLGARGSWVEDSFGVDDFAFFPDTVAGALVQQAYSAALFRDWVACDAMAGAVALQQADSAPARWRWLFRAD